MRGKWSTLLAPVVAVGLLIPGAHAQDASPSPAPTATVEPSTVTLEVSREALRFGETLRLSGTVDPVVPETEVSIVDRDGSEVAMAVPDDDGSYSVKIVPGRSLRIHAEWLEATSETQTVSVRARARVSLQKVRLFGAARVSGRVAPAGDRIEVVLVRNGARWKRKVVPTRDGRFSFRAPITQPGRFRARVFYSPEGLRIGKASSTSRRAAIPRSLTVGSKGGDVKRLEKRLLSLGYYLPRADRSYGVETRDAVIAFNKIHGRVRSGSVDAGTWRALASPRTPKPRHRGSHIEVDQTQQVVLIVRKGKVRWILHTSTGAGGASRNGTWTVNRKVAGYSPGRLYYPSYYDGLRAVHGWPDVPTYPASHGCARVPMWSATWIHSKMPIGTTVYVYH